MNLLSFHLIQVSGPQSWWEISVPVIIGDLNTSRVVWRFRKTLTSLAHTGPFSSTPQSSDFHQSCCSVLGSLWRLETPGLGCSLLCVLQHSPLETCHFPRTLCESRPGVNTPFRNSALMRMWAHHFSFGNLPYAVSPLLPSFLPYFA